MKQHNKRGVALFAAIMMVLVSTSYFLVEAKAPEQTKETPNPKVVEQNSKIDEPTLEISTETEEIKEDVPVVEEFIGYTTDPLRVRVEPNTECEILDVYQVNTEIKYVIENDHWVKIKYDDKDAYMCKDYISDTMVEVVVEEVQPVVYYEEETNNQTTTSGENYNYNYNGGALTPSAGVFYGPSGKETYYNLDMSGVISIMRGMGNNDEYWVREDGVKMLGAYVMVAADLNIYPRGSLVPTSLGTGIVCDTGGFASNGSGVALDIATAW